MYGAYYYGQPYFGQSPTFTVTPDTSTRPNCGGMWGTATFGQPYFGQHVQCPEPAPPTPPTPATRTWCGGIWGTATFGQMYFGGHNQCPAAEQPGSAPQTDGGSFQWLVSDRPLPRKKRLALDEEEEELMVILALVSGRN